MSENDTRALFDTLIAAMPETLSCMLNGLQKFHTCGETDPLLRVTVDRNGLDTEDGYEVTVEFDEKPLEAPYQCDVSNLRC